MHRYLSGLVLMFVASALSAEENSTALTVRSTEVTVFDPSTKDQATVSCVPSEVKEPGVYMLERELPMGNDESFSRIQASVHIGQNQQTGSLEVAFIRMVEYQFNKLSKQAVAEGKFWKRSGPVISAIQAYNNYQMTSVNKSYELISSTQLLALGSFQFNCDEETGVISWEDNGSYMESGSNGTLRLVASDQRMLLMGQMTSYNTSGVAYDFGEKYVSYVLQRFTSADTGYRYVFESMPLFGVKMTEPVIEEY